MCTTVSYTIATRNLRRAGIAGGIMMKIDWRTRSLFVRYAIVSQTDIPMH